jgi:hypothetical protein
LCPNVESGAEDHDQRQYHELDPPPHRPDSRPERLFQVHQDQDERNKVDAVQDLRDRAELRLLDKWSFRHHLKQLIVEADQQADWQQTDDDQRNAPPRQKLARVCARVGEAERQPDCWNDTLEDKCCR